MMTNDQQHAAVENAAANGLWAVQLAARRVHCSKNV